MKVYRLLCAAVSTCMRGLEPHGQSWRFRAPRPTCYLSNLLEHIHLELSHVEGSCSKAAFLSASLARTPQEM
jgi:hypothetical protein